MEIKKGHTVYLKKENPKLQNTPTSGKVHSVGKTHAIIRTVGGTGMYKARLDNLSHDRNDSWLSQKYKKEEAPVNAVGGGAIAGIGVGPQGEPPMKKKRKPLRRFRSM